MVIDDSSANLQLCKGLLDEEYDVRLAKSGRIALETLDRLRPDLILLDIEMPEMSGFEVLDMINRDRNLQDIPVIFVTSHASEDLVVKAVEHGAANYIVKPFKADILRARIENALHMHDELG